MLYLIGLGLNERAISKQGLDVIKKCKKIYLENYTVEFPYSVKKLEKVICKKIIEIGRTDVESEMLIKEGKKNNICVLIYGSPLFATTHMSLLNDCKKARVKFEVIYSSSVFDAIALSGLQLYKFGKISSMPKWEKSFTPDSFLEYVEENASINAHSLILIDIGLEFKDALEELRISCKNRKFRLGKIVVCSLLGTDKSKIYYEEINKLLKKNVLPPFCFIIPAKLHFIEKESLKEYEL